MLSVLSERQKAIVEAITMRLHTKPALHYLRDVGYKMSEATYFREKKKIEEMKFERMQHIAMYFQDQHLERIDKCECVEKLMWKNYHEEKDSSKKVKILESIISIQPYISAYYDATRYVLEKKVKTETDLYTTLRPYVSIDVRKNREEEMEKEEQERRNQEAVKFKNEPTDRTFPKAIEW